ncbi:MotA/TolQ/ExbB proton channel family protein [Marivibrio halodurans]|uniref:MotA/TolQ/ExbB proton channel family protein n=1 Tax=Marivibrio halodurans TaxID=2039722 RepID=A0A8J7RZV6_9PROT|nr:MotA/TolQ/ExbB proton channel family protein [Marivibrio halodurans]MBP5856109.1 MotA/TolQ/ExbB proton channel family protein [Marivibrio halodurans]
MASEAEDGPRRPLTQPTTRTAIDVATLGGMIAAAGLIGMAILLGGSPTAFLDLPSVLIVIGGTLGVTTACYSLKDMGGAGKTVMRTILRAHDNPSEAAVQLLQLSQIGRHKGTLALQNYLVALEDSPMLHQGLQMAIDGTPAEEVERIMRREVQSIAQRQSRSVAILRKAAEISPAMGLIGTLVGLIQMLGNLDDPSTIGPSMAVALLTTFYGALLANVVFTPLASKMERNAAEDMLVNHMHVMATASIARQENPRRLEMLLNTILPPSERVDYFG